MLGDDLMKLPWLRIIILGSFTLLLAACSQAGVLALTDDTQSSPALPASATQMAPEKNETHMTQPAPTSGMESLIEKAREDLAKRLSIEITEISLVGAKEVVWPDASLGCPKRGVFYIQVLTDGYRILLDANATTYEYHTDTGEQVVLCENPEFPIFPVTPGEIDDGEPWMPN
jgi:hypothetical protein